MIKMFFSTKYIDGFNGSYLYKQSSDLQKEVIEVAKELKKLYSKIGIDRNMNLKDLLFVIKDGNIVGCIPVDFEKIDYNDNLDWEFLLEVADQLGIEINKDLIPQNVNQIHNHL